MTKFKSKLLHIERANSVDLDDEPPHEDLHCLHCLRNVKTTPKETNLLLILPSADSTLQER